MSKRGNRIACLFAALVMCAGTSSYKAYAAKDNNDYNTDDIKPVYVYSTDDDLKTVIGETLLETRPELSEYIVYTDVEADGKELEKVLTKDDGNTYIVCLGEKDMEKYLQGDYFKSVSELGISEDAYSDAYEYTKEAGTKDGSLMALTWKSETNLFYYRTDIAKKVFGVDEAGMNKMLSTPDGFIEAALKLKSSGYKMCIGDDYLEAVNGDADRISALQKYMEDNGLTDSAAKDSQEYYSKLMNSDIMFGFFGTQSDYNAIKEKEGKNAELYNAGTGPVSYSDNSYIAVSSNSPDNELAAELLETICCDETVAGQLAENDIFTNKKSVNNALSDNQSAKPFVGLSDGSSVWELSISSALSYKKCAKSEGCSFAGIHGTEYYMKDGKVYETFTGLAEKNKELVYVEKGKVNTTANTLVKHNGEWLCVNAGKYNSKANTLVYYNGTNYYVRNGKVDFGYTNLVKLGNTWYYIKNGKWMQNSTTLVKYNNVWYYVKNGKVDFATTTLHNYYGVWYYIKNGKVDFNSTTLCKYGKTWYYIKNGRICNDTTLCKYGQTWYYVSGGKICNSTTLCKYGKTWYYVSGGKLCNRTTLCKYKDAWFYVKNGKVDLSATTLCKYGSKWYYVKNGRVDFKATTLCKYGNVWYYVKNGVMNTTDKTLCLYGKKWYYVSGGKLDLTKNGNVKNGNSICYVRNGVYVYRRISTPAGKMYAFDPNGNKLTGWLQFEDNWYFFDEKSYEMTYASKAMHDGIKLAKNEKSDTNYMIFVDTTACEVLVFQGKQGEWTPIKDFICAPGLRSTPTKKGRFKVAAKGYVFGDTYSCYYYTQFCGDYLFHSIKYYKGTFKVKDGTLGKPRSQGCVRLALENAKWIYDNIPAGTFVWVY